MRMFKELRGKEYGERLNCSNLWTLEERQNRKDMVEICSDRSRYTVNMAIYTQ